RYLLRAGLALSCVIIPAMTRAQETAFLGKPTARWVEELASPDARVRRSAAFALGKGSGLAVYTVPKLVRALKDPDAGVREAAASSLGESGPAAWQPAYPVFLEILPGDTNPRARRSAAFALGNLGRLALVEEDKSASAVRGALHKALADPD